MKIEGGKTMGWFAKNSMKLEDLASDLSNLVLRSIEPSKLENLKEWSVNPENSKHRLEIVILSLFSLRAAILSTLDQDKGNTLLLFVEQILKTSYEDILSFGTTEQSEIFLQNRYEDYNDLDRFGSPIPRVGLRFAKNIGIEDAALIYWADMFFKKTRQMYVELLSAINEKYDLVI
jgi:hypothetical protein